MFSNPITGRRFIPPNEPEAINPDPSLTLAVLVFCIAGPFWLLYRLVEHLVKRGASITIQSRKKDKILPEDKVFP